LRAERSNPEVCFLTQSTQGNAKIFVIPAKAGISSDKNEIAALFSWRRNDGGEENFVILRVLCDFVVKTTFLD